MSESFKWQHYYLDAGSGQALGVVYEGETATWGRCMVVELATPGRMGQLTAIPLEADAARWREITADEFGRIQKECVGGVMAAVQRRRKWWRFWRR